MRIALFADLHSNLEALQACLRHAARHGVRRYAFLGDLVGYGFRGPPDWRVRYRRQDTHRYFSARGTAGQTAYPFSPTLEEMSTQIGDSAYR